jgi:mRNA-degrading endonuclease RelE of RelBE toxin-antitoxin system
MRLVETSKFKKLRKKIKESHEKEALKQAISIILEGTDVGKPLKGEFKELRSYGYTVKGQNRRLIYRKDEDTIVLLSFGPRDGIYN